MKVKKIFIAIYVIVFLTLIGIGSVSIGTAVFNYPPAPKVDDSKIKVACIGDSVTYGAGVFMKNRTKNSYPAQLQVMLGDDYNVLNYGLSGRTVTKSADRPYQNEKFFKLSQEAKPDIAIIMLGSNDTKPYNWSPLEFRADLVDFVNLYKGICGKVYLMTCCDAFAVEGKSDVAFGINKAYIANQVRSTIMSVALELDVTLIDIYAVTEGHPELFSDGVHPNAEGNGLLARTVYNALIA